MQLYKQAFSGFLVFLGVLGFAALLGGLLIYGGPRGESSGLFGYLSGLIFGLVAGVAGFTAAKFTLVNRGVEVWGILTILFGIFFMVLRIVTMSYWTWTGPGTGISEQQDSFAWMPSVDILYIAFALPICGSLYARKVVSKAPLFSLQTQKILEGTWKGRLSSMVAIITIITIAKVIMTGLDFISYSMLDHFYSINNSGFETNNPLAYVFVDKIYLGQLIFTGVTSLLVGWFTYIFARKDGLRYLLWIEVVFFILYSAIWMKSDGRQYGWTLEYYLRAILSSSISGLCWVGGIAVGGWIASNAILRLGYETKLIDQPQP